MSNPFNELTTTETNAMLNEWATTQYTRLVLGNNSLVVHTSTYKAFDDVLNGNCFGYGEDKNFVMHYGEADCFSKTFTCRTATYLLGHEDITPQETVILNGVMVKLEDLIPLDMFIGHGATWHVDLVVQPVEDTVPSMDDIPF